MPLPVSKPTMSKLTPVTLVILGSKGTHIAANTRAICYAKFNRRNLPDTTFSRPVRGLEQAEGERASPNQIKCASPETNQTPTPGRRQYSSELVPRFFQRYPLSTFQLAMAWNSLRNLDNE